MPPQPTTRRYGAKITTVDPTQGLVEAVTKDGTIMRVSVYTIPTAFRWPQVGENWMIRQENGSWYLEGYWPTTDDFQGIEAGDVVITAPTGIIYVTQDDASAPTERVVTTTATPPTVTGSRSSGAALESLLTQLAAAKLIIDNTTT
jgi:hypothetical protein